MEKKRMLLGFSNKGEGKETFLLVVENYITEEDGAKVQWISFLIVFSITAPLNLLIKFGFKYLMIKKRKSHYIGSMWKKIKFLEEIGKKTICWFLRNIHDFSCFLKSIFQ